MNKNARGKTVRNKKTRPEVALRKKDGASL